MQYFLIRRIIPRPCNGTMRSYFRELHFPSIFINDCDLIFVVSALAQIDFLNSTGHDPIKITWNRVFRMYFGVHLCASLSGQWVLCPAAPVSAGSVGPCGSASKGEAGVLVRPSIREHQDCHTNSI